MPQPDDQFEPIENATLDHVAGGAKGNSEVTAALSAIQGSLKDLGGSKNSGSDPMQMMLMMMMMGGLGGGGGGVAAAPAAATAPVINIDTSVVGGGGGHMVRRRGKKGW